MHNYTANSQQRVFFFFADLFNRWDIAKKALFLGNVYRTMYDFNFFLNYYGFLDIFNDYWSLFKKCYWIFIMMIFNLFSTIWIKSSLDMWPKRDFFKVLTTQEKSKKNIFPQRLHVLKLQNIYVVLMIHQINIVENRKVNRNLL